MNSATTTESPVVTTKMRLMASIRTQVLDKYTGSKPHGTLTRASRELNIDPHVLAEINMGAYWRFSLDRLIELGDKLGLKIDFKTE